MKATPSFRYVEHALWYIQKHNLDANVVKNKSTGEYDIIPWLNESTPVDKAS